MTLDNNLLNRLEKLSYLEVSDDKRAEIIEQLNEIVSFVDNLSELDTDGVNETFAMTDAATPLRDDTPECHPQIHNDIIKHAPKSADSFFVVPKIIE